MADKNLPEFFLISEVHAEFLKILRLALGGHKSGSCVIYLLLVYKPK